MKKVIIFCLSVLMFAISITTFAAKAVPVEVLYMNFAQRLPHLLQVRVAAAMTPPKKPSNT